jgi:3'-5' exoribonuclease
MELTVKKSYLIFDIIKSVAKDGRPFFKMILSDEGKLINGIMFETSRLTFDPSKGDIVEISAILQSYNNKPQLKVNEMEFVSSEGSAAFLPKSKHDPAQMEEDLKKLLQKYVTDEWLSGVIEKFYDDKESYNNFILMPAAKTMHHAYLHGLLEHTLGVVKLAIKVSDLYPHVNKSLVIAGALFHDVGKTQELDISAGFEYTGEGRLLGHLMQGYTMVRGYIEEIEGFPLPLKQHFLHLIASHHGAMEFGSPQVPKTAEALLLNFIDDMDAKLNAFQLILEREGVEPGGWSGYDRLLERQIFWAI